MDVFLAVAVLVQCTARVQGVLRVVDALPQLGLKDAIWVVLSLHVTSDLHGPPQSLLDRALGVCESTAEVLAPVRAAAILAPVGKESVASAMTLDSTDNNVLNHAVLHCSQSKGQMKAATS